MKRKGLGKGLGALLPPTDSNIEENGLRNIPVEAIRPNPDQPRTKFDPTALEELAESIGEHGLIQPLIVTEDEPGQYTLIAGERRWRASQIAGIPTVPVVVKDATPQERMEWALIENIQRADLNPIEEAMAYQHLSVELGLTQAALSKRVGKSRSEVANRMRLLELPANIQQDVTDEKLSYGHARVLVTLPTPEAQRSVANQIMRMGLSVRQAEGIAKKLREGIVPKPKVKKRLSPEMFSLEAQFREQLGTKVNIQVDGENAGKVVIHFYNDEDLQALFEAIVGGRTST